MDNDQTLMDLGMEYAKWPITQVRIHRTDGQWLVEYRRKPKWFLDKWWWFNDGKYVKYFDAKCRAAQLASQGYIESLRYVRDNYTVTPFED
jgi:hypothetical protein